MLPQKADPLAQADRAPPATASVVAAPAPYPLARRGWMAKRARRQRPTRRCRSTRCTWLLAAAAHDASAALDCGTSRSTGSFPTSSTWASPMSSCCRSRSIRSAAHGATSRSAMFAPTGALRRPRRISRVSSMRCHAAGIGVILDWVPAHFPTDAHGLARFDGTALYEHEDPREGFHQDWNTLIYNFGRHEVQGFLIASALHWLEHFHVDGLRVDAVASMLYRDYSRKAGEWVPNIYGGRENLEAIEFLRHLNAVVARALSRRDHDRRGIDRLARRHAPVGEGGLGFTYKWNMGWMHDTLHYMERTRSTAPTTTTTSRSGWSTPSRRTSSCRCRHDEVVHGKGSLISKMPGDRWQKFANLRAYLGYMWAHPGKKLLFMGGEIAQGPNGTTMPRSTGTCWTIRATPACSGWCATSTASIAAEPALHATRQRPAGFRWVVGDDGANSVFAFLRRRRGGRSAGARREQHDASAAASATAFGVPQRGHVARDRQHGSGLYTAAVERRQRRGGRDRRAIRRARASRIR